MDGLTREWRRGLGDAARVQVLRSIVKERTKGVVAGRGHYFNLGEIKRSCGNGECFAREEKKC